MSKVDLFFFDFDGVIKDSVKIKGEAFIKLFSDRSEDFRRKIYLDHIENGGVSRSVKIKRWLAWLNIQDEVTFHRYVRKFSDLVIEGVIHSDWVPGALDLISVVETTPKFILTGTPQAEILVILKKLNILHRFDGVFGAEFQKAVVVKSLIDLHKVRSERCVLLGDSAVDQNAASANGVPFYLRRTDYNLKLHGSPDNWLEGEDLFKLKQTLYEGLVD